MIPRRAFLAGLAASLAAPALAKVPVFDAPRITPPPPQAPPAFATVSGPGVHYQWLRDGIPITGATSQTFGPVDAGGVYNCRITVVADDEEPAGDHPDRSERVGPEEAEAQAPVPTLAQTLPLM
jgi:hypothetical protein